MGFAARISVLRTAINRPWPKRLLALVGALGIFDTVQSQFIPPGIIEIPKAWEVVKYAMEALPDMSPLAWLVLLLLVIAGSAVEYAYRGSSRRTSAGSQLEPARPMLQNQSPLAATARYALPQEAKALALDKTTNRDLGELMSALAVDIQKIFGPRIGDLTDRQVLSIFMSRYASRFFWLYGEALRRGHSDTFLGAVYEDPARLLSKAHVSRLADSLSKFADIVKLRA